MTVRLPRVRSGALSSIASASCAPSIERIFVTMASGETFVLTEDLVLLGSFQLPLRVDEIIAPIVYDPKTKHLMCCHKRDHRIIAIGLDGRRNSLLDPSYVGVKAFRLDNLGNLFVVQQCRDGSHRLVCGGNFVKLRPFRGLVLSDHPIAGVYLATKSAVWSGWNVVVYDSRLRQVASFSAGLSRPVGFDARLNALIVEHDTREGFVMRAFNMRGDVILQSIDCRSVLVHCRMMRVSHGSVAVCVENDLLTVAKPTFVPCRPINVLSRDDAVVK